MDGKWKIVQYSARPETAIGGQKLGNARNSNKPRSGVSQIHLRQLFHFINVRSLFSLSYPRFLQTGLNIFCFIK